MTTPLKSSNVIGEDSNLKAKNKIKSPKKTNVSDNSIAAYIEIKADGQLSREKTRAINAMTKHRKALTRRQLADLTGLEVTNCCRILYDLERMGLIINAFSAPCPKTHKTVSWYQIAEQLEQSA